MPILQFDPGAVFGKTKKQPNTKASDTVNTPGGATSFMDIVSQASGRSGPSLGPGQERLADLKGLREEFLPLLNDNLQRQNQIASQEFPGIDTSLLSRRDRRVIMRGRARDPYFDLRIERKWKASQRKALRELSQEARLMTNTFLQLDPVGAAAVETQLEQQKALAKRDLIAIQMENWISLHTQTTGIPPTSRQQAVALANFSDTDTPDEMAKSAADTQKAMNFLGRTMTDEEIDSDPLFRLYAPLMKRDRDSQPDLALEEFMEPGKLLGMMKDFTKSNLRYLQVHAPLLMRGREETETSSEAGSLAEMLGLGGMGGQSVVMTPMPDDIAGTLLRRAEVRAASQLRKLVTQQGGDWNEARKSLLIDDELMVLVDAYDEATPKQRRLAESAMLDRLAIQFNRKFVEARDADVFAFPGEEAPEAPPTSPVDPNAPQ